MAIFVMGSGSLGSVPGYHSRPVGRVPILTRTPSPRKDEGGRMKDEPDRGLLSDSSFIPHPLSGNPHANDHPRRRGTAPLRPTLSRGTARPLPAAPRPLRAAR